MAALFTESELNRLLQSLDDVPSGMELCELNGDPTWSMDDIFDPGFPLLEDDSLLHPVTDLELTESEPRESSSSPEDDQSEPPESDDREDPGSQPSLEDNRLIRILQKELLDRSSQEKSREELLEKLAEMNTELKNDVKSFLAELQKEITEVLRKYA